MKNLNELAKRMKEGGWGKIPKGQYPRPYFDDYVKIAHPEIYEEFKAWFDTEVRA